MPIVPPTSTLQAIQTKVRRLTRSPSLAQLTDADLQNYINTFVVYDFPEHLRTFNLHRQFTFFANPFQDVYPTNEIDLAGVTTNPLYNFQNLYISVNDPVFIAGYQSLYTQDRSFFFSIYPQVTDIASIGPAGDGVTAMFTGVINSQQQGFPNPNQQQSVCLVKRQVLFSSVDSNGNGLSLADIPLLDPATGNQTVLGNLYDVNSADYQAALVTPPTTADLIANNNINYITGAFTCTFPNPPGPGVPINSQTLPQIPSLPQAILYHNNTFTLRPVPDQPYRIQIEVYARPTALLNLNQSPQLEEYWQYIAYGAAKKIFEDKMDIESVQMILPEYHKQEMLVNRRTIVQNTNDRVATIYTENQLGPGWYGWGQGGGNF